MDTPSQASPFQLQLIDINALRVFGIFPAGREPSIRTLRKWTKLRVIPCTRMGGRVYFHLAEVSHHICTKLKVPAR